MSCVVVLGASPNPRRFSYRTILKLQQKHYIVYALGIHNGSVGETEIITNRPLIENVDSVLLYINPLHQKDCYDYIMAIKPRRIIFNPGTENPELAKMAEAENIAVMENCSLNMLCINIF